MKIVQRFWINHVTSRLIKLHMICSIIEINFDVVNLRVELILSLNSGLNLLIPKVPNWLKSKTKLRMHSWYTLQLNHQLSQFKFWPVHHRARYTDFNYFQKWSLHLSIWVKTSEKAIQSLFWAVSVNTTEPLLRD